MTAGVKFHQFVEDKHHGVHDFSTHAVYVCLSNVAPDASTDAVLADITEIAAGNGYTSGGQQLTLLSEGQTAGTYKAIYADSVFTANGGPMATFRYAIYYNHTQTTPLKPLIGYHDYGSAITLSADGTFTIDLDATAGFLTET